MSIEGKVVDQMEISFHGLETAEERQTHSEGLAKWMCSKYPECTDKAEFYIEGAKSNVNEILKKEQVEETVTELHNRVKERAKHKSYRNLRRGEYVDDEAAPTPIVRHKADHTNKNWNEYY